MVVGLRGSQVGCGRWPVGGGGDWGAVECTFRGVAHVGRTFEVLYQTPGPEDILVIISWGN